MLLNFNGYCRPSNGATDESASEQTASQNLDDGPEGMAPDGVIEVSLVLLDVLIFVLNSFVALLSLIVSENAPNAIIPVKNTHFIQNIESPLSFKKSLKFES